MKYIITIFICCCSLTLFCQNSAGRYVKDFKTGCKVWDPIYSKDDSISWNGPCKNGMAEGCGTLIWFDKGKEATRYNGYLSKGNPNGQGEYVNKDGSKIHGNWNDGEILNVDSTYLKCLEKRIVSKEDSAGIYTNAGTAKSLFYYALVPKRSIKGVLVLMPSSWESGGEVLSNNIKLSELAVDNNILVIVPSINNDVCLSDNVLKFLNKVFADVIEKYKAPKDGFVLGGLSLGGMLSLRYTELAYEGNTKTTVVPVAVFGADPPVDLSNLYHQFERFAQRSHILNQDTSYETRFYLDNMKKYFGGTPEQNPKAYVKYSMYSRSETEGGNTKFLKNVPVRIYCDPDIEFQMKRDNDYYDMNAPDLTAMINLLHSLGNSRAEFINELGKGYRLNGKRNPHSWSIVEPNDCINWFLQYVK